jgi:hypothetical protein
MQPGQVINPGGDQLPTPLPQQPEDATPPPQTPEPTTPAEQSQQPTSSAIPTPLPVDDNGDLRWTASEFIEHQKPQGWYVSVGLGGFLVAGLLYFISKDIVTSVVVLIAALLFAAAGARKPRAMPYVLSRGGLQIGEKAYPYSMFKSFSVIEEGAIDSIQFLPLKRFMPPISIYFPPEQEDQIVELLADYLPHEDRDHDAIDRLMKRLHF